MGNPQASSPRSIEAWTIIVLRELDVDGLSQQSIALLQKDLSACVTLWRYFAEFEPLLTEKQLVQRLSSIDKLLSELEHSMQDLPFRLTATSLDTGAYAPPWKRPRPSDLSVRIHNMFAQDTNRIFATPKAEWSAPLDALRPIRDWVVAAKNAAADERSDRHAVGHYHQRHAAAYKPGEKELVSALLFAWERLREGNLGLPKLSTSNTRVDFVKCALTRIAYLNKTTDAVIANISAAQKAFASHVDPHSLVEHDLKWQLPTTSSAPNYSEKAVLKRRKTRM